MYTEVIMNLCGSIFVYFVHIINSERKQHRYSHLITSCCGDSGTITVHRAENNDKLLLYSHAFETVAFGETLRFELLIEPDESIMIGNLLYKDNDDTFNTHRSYYLNIYTNNNQEMCISFDNILMYSWTDEMPYGIYEIMSLNNWQANFIL